MPILTLLSGKTKKVILITIEPAIFQFNGKVNIASNSLVNIDAANIIFATYGISAITGSEILRGTASQLRLDDMSLIEAIKEKLVENQIETIDVIDGYPNDASLIIPAVSVEHILTSDKAFELTQREKTFRLFRVDIFARTKGERDNISSAIESLLYSDVVTEDGRSNTLTSIEHITDYTPIDKTVTTRQQYGCVRFSTTNTYGDIQNVSNVAYSNPDYNFIIELDLSINAITYETNYLISNYLPIDGALEGHQVYISSNGYLTIVVGIGDTSYSHTVNFNNYLNKRIRLGILFYISSFRYTSIIYVDGLEVSSKSQFIFALPTKSQSKYYVGTSIDIANNGLPFGETSDITVYGVRVNKSTNYSALTKTEKLFPHISDIILLLFNEGRDEYVYDKTKVVSGRNMTLYGNYLWDNYLSELKKGYLYNRRVLKLTLDHNKV